MAARHRETGHPHRVRRTVIGVIAVVLVASLGFVGYEYVSLKSGIHTSDILLPTPGSTPTAAASEGPKPDVNILIMGLTAGSTSTATRCPPTSMRPCTLVTRPTGG